MVREKGVSFRTFLRGLQGCIHQFFGRFLEVYRAYGLGFRSSGLTNRGGCLGILALGTPLAKVNMLRYLQQSERNHVMPPIAFASYLPPQNQRGSQKVSF